MLAMLEGAEEEAELMRGIMAVVVARVSWPFETQLDCDLKCLLHPAY